MKILTILVSASLAFGCADPPLDEDVEASTASLNAGPPDPARSRVKIDRLTAAAGGTDAVVITVTARDAGGHPVKGYTATLFATGGGNLLDQPTEVTDKHGVTTGRLRSTVAGSKTVHAFLRKKQVVVALDDLPTTTFQPLQSISVAPIEATVAQGGTQQLTALATFADGTIADVTPYATWTSTNIVVATIDASGVATGHNLGHAVLNASLAGVVSNAATLHVNQVTALAVSPGTASVAVGTSRQFTAFATFASGAVAKVTDDVTWTSSKRSVASIDPAGLATGNDLGSVSIVASLAGVSNTATLHVRAVTDLVVSPRIAYVGIGGRRQVTAVATLADGTVADVTPYVTWLNSNFIVASVNASGLVTGRSLGDTSIQARLAGVVSNAASFHVVEVTDVFMGPQKASVPVGGSWPFGAFATLAPNGTNVDVTNDVTWTSINTAVATIDASGLATGHNLGNAVIYASLAGVVRNTGTLHVGEVTDLLVDPAAASVAIGSNRHFHAIATFDDGSVAEVSDDVTWTSTNTVVATIDASGLATGHNQGHATIVASREGVVGNTAALHVYDVSEVTDLVINPVLASVAVGDTQFFGAFATFTDGTVGDVTEDVTWSSGDANVASIDAPGVVIGRGPGHTTITARLGVFRKTASLVVF